MKESLAIKESIDLNQLSKEVLEILNILQQIESHTADLRKRIINELASNEKGLNLNLDTLNE